MDERAKVVGRSRERGNDWHFERIEGRRQEAVVEVDVCVCDC